MLEFIIGRAGTGKTYACLNSMKKILEHNPLRAPIYMLMPAYMTYKAERKFAEMTNGAINTYFCSFQRFAQQVLLEVGGTSIPRITDIGRRLIMKKILLQRSQNLELKYFAKSARQRGFSESLTNMLKEFRSYSITPDMLREATYNLENDELNDKISDLAMLTEDFRNAIEGQKNDDEDILELAAEYMRESQIIKQSEIYIDGFIFFDPQQRQIIKSLLQNAENVHITLPMETDLNHAENLRETGLFNRSFRTFKMIMEMAEELKIDVEITRLIDTKNRFKRGALALLEQKLFEFPPKAIVNESETDSIKFVEAANKRAEIEATAQDILKLRKERNYKFSDFGILIRNDQYNNLIKPIFENHEIPFFNDTKRIAAHHPLAELIRSSLEILHGWRPSAIIRCLRTGFFDLEIGDIDLLENYIIEFGIRGSSSWLNDKDWTYYRREIDDNRNEMQEWEKKNLEQVNKIRKQVAAILSKFSAAVNGAIKASEVKKSASVLSLAEALFSLLENLSVPEILSKWSAEAEAKGDLALSREHLRIWNDITAMLEQFVEVMGEEVLTIKEFEALIDEGIESIQMSLIPPGLDEVTIAQFDQNSLQNTKAIYILGCSEGEMPRKSREKGLLSDADRLHLNENNVEISKGGLEGSLAEKFLLYRGMTEASEYLCISYPLANDEGESLIKSPLVDKITSMIPNIKVEFIPIEILGTNSEFEFIRETQQLTPQTAEKLFAPWKKLKGSITKIEQFNACPFKHFAHYGLRLEERRERKFSAFDLGNLLHAALRRFGELMQNENRRWSSVKDDELITIVDKIFLEIAPRLHNNLMSSSNAYKYQLERIKKLAIRSLRRLIKFDSVSHFRPEQFEVDFGNKNKNPLSYDLNDKIKMEISGKIDRIDFDENGKYFMIMDYKTGSNVYINLLDIYFGLNLQLLTYLLAVKSKFVDQIPAGMFYFLLRYPQKRVTSDSTEDEIRAAIEKELKMPGWVLADKNVVNKIDSSHNFIKIAFNRAGDFANYKTTQECIKTEEQFNILMRYVSDRLQDAGRKIIGGEIAARPFKKFKSGKNGCEYCVYSAVCGFDPIMKNNDWLKIPEIDDEEIMKRIGNKKLETVETNQTTLTFTK